MSMQNLTTSANLQMFSKVLQDAVPSRAQQSPRTNASVSAGDVGEPQGKGQHGQLSAADLHQLMLSQLDQQFYLSQLAGLGSSDASVAAPPPDSSSSSFGGINSLQHFTSVVDLPTSSTAACNSSDSATTTTSSASSSSSAMDGKHCAAGGSGGLYGIDSTMSTADLLGQQLTHQKLMEQFLEVATTVAGEGGNNQQLSGGGTTPSAEEMMVSQLMAQLVNGTSGPIEGGETHGQLTSHSQQLMGAGGGQQQQRTDGAQSPSSSQHQQQMPLSLLDQLQLLQMLGSSGANPSSVPGLAELLAAGGLSSSTSSENLAQLLKGVGGAGGSPNKAEQVYCELCDKWLCNRYFMKTHMLKKHGIGEATSSTNSPLKNGVGNFSFGTSAQFSADESTARSHSVSGQPPQMELATQRNESPPIGRLAPKLSLSSTPGVMGGGNVPGDTSTTFNEALSPEHSQQMAVMQQLAAQLGLANGGAGEGGRNALFEQIFGSSSGLHLAELMGQTQQHHQLNDVHRSSSPVPGRSPPTAFSGGDTNQNSSIGTVASSHFACASCSKHFSSQSALFQHQLTEHITDLQQQQSSNDAQSSMNALAMMAAAGIGGGNAGGQQQQLFGHLLGSNPFPQGTAPSMMFTNAATSAAYGGLNPTEFDGAAMLAKLSAEFAAVAQGQHGQSGGASTATAQPTGGHPQNGMMGARGQTPAPSNKPPPQKRQYSSTSKNFCDLCNKEVCNKYFLRTHMLKMHNIIIDENKQLIANIDTADKERKGEVKFRCDICHASMNTRDELKLHKREAHGMSTGGGAQSTPLGSRGAPKATLSTAATSAAGAMDAAGGTQQQKLVPPFPAPASHFSATMEHHQQTTQQQMSQLRTTPEGTASANDENQPLGEQQTTRDSAGGTQQSPLVGANPMKQLLSLIGGDETLPPSLVGGARLLPATNVVKKETEEQLGRTIADANNNATSCRFCGLYLEEEVQLQLHQLVEHPNEYMAALQPTLDLQQQQSASKEDKLITQVALKMVEENSHHHQQQQQQQQQQQLRKTSVASSGASSSSAASSGDIGTAHCTQQQKTKNGTAPRVEDGSEGGGHPCPQCKRVYKSVQKMERHQRTVHHNFVAKLSPVKRTIISPKKIAKLMTSFSCQKCRRRFATRLECDEHVISHIRLERLKQEGAEAELQEEGEEERDRGPQVKRAKVEGEAEDSGGGSLMVDEGEEEEEVMAEQQRQTEIVREAGKMLSIGGGEEERQRGHRRTKGAGGEKHSHTSGSTSPVSVQAGSSGSGLPEGFAHPLLDHAKPFVLQSFTLRPISPHSNSQLPDELVAYLPVRSTLGQPIRVTFELSPTPQVDQQVQHL